MSVQPPRYLAPFPSQAGSALLHRRADHRRRAGRPAGGPGGRRRLSVLVVTKDGLQQSNSAYAQGGIAGVLDPEDRFEDHVADTLEAGGPLCDPRGRRAGGPRGPAADRGTDRLGHPASTRPADRLALGREGGHGHDRIVHALGDATGKEVMRAVIERVAGGSTRRGLGRDLHDRPARPTRAPCRGALVWNREHGKTLVWAKQTILATGGAGQIYRETTNPDVATGDGMALAYRAGAELRDMEFVQFHPTVLYIAGGSRSLISEAMRGEGAHLVDRHGHRFMPDYDPRGGAGPARRGEPVHRQPDGEDAASERLSRPDASRPAAGAVALPRASRRSARSSTWTSPATAFRCGPGPTT